MLRNMFGNCIGIDIGTVNTLIAVKGEGIVLREPSAIALEAGKPHHVLGAGNDAIRLLGRSPGGLTVQYPMQDGVIADISLCEQMLTLFFKKAVGKRLPAFGHRVVACVPGCMSGVERRALEDALKGAGAKDVYLMEEPLAAAIGAGLDVENAKGIMLVDIGGGTTDAAVMALGGIVTSNSHKVGGKAIDQAIAAHVKKEYGVVIGDSTAEHVKCTLVSAVMENMGCLLVRGRDMETGLPKEVELASGEVNFAARVPIRGILDCIRETLKNTPPEVSGDLMETGITLTGGGALLNHIDELIEYDTGIKVHICSEPMDAVAKGALMVAEQLRGLKPRMMETEVQLPLS